MTRTKNGIGAKAKAHSSLRTALVVLVAGLLATFAIAAATWREHETAMDAERRALVEIGARGLEFGIADHVDLVVSLQAYLEGAGGVPEIGQLRGVLARLARGQKAVHGIGFLPRVRHENRAAFEEAARKAGFKDFAIVERTLGNRGKPAAERDEYFPVFVVEPSAANAATMGFDAASEPTRRKLLEKARDSGELVATAVLHLVDAGDVRGFMVAAPVYTTPSVPDTVAARRAALAGYAFGVFRLGEMMEDVFEQAGAPPQFEYYFFEGDAARTSNLIFARRPGRAEADEPAPALSPERLARGVTSKIRVVDRTWSVVSVPSRGDEFDPGILTWAVLLVGGVGTLAVGFHLISSARRTRELVDLAENLSRSRSALEREIAVREAAQSQLAAALTILEQSSTAISRWTFLPGQGFPRLDYVSPNFARFGHAPEEVAGAGAPFVHLAHPDDRDLLRRAMESVVKERPAEAQNEFRLVGKDGKVIWVEGTMTFEWDENGGGRSVGILRDISERKAIEAAAKASTERLEHFQRLTIGREHDMLRLKGEVNELLGQLGRPQRYAAPARVAALRKGAEPASGKVTEAL